MTEEETTVEITEAEAAQNGQAAAVQPGEVSPEELFTLYAAGEIKQRALNEQVAARDQALAAWSALGAKLMELLGVEEVDAILPMVEGLTKNRQARRSEAKSKRSRKQPS